MEYKGIKDATNQRHMNSKVFKNYESYVLELHYCGLEST